MTTLADFRSRVRTLTGIESAGVLSDAEVNNFVNEAFMYVAVLADWPWLVEQETFIVPAGSDTFVVPGLSSTAHRVIDVFGRQSSEEKVRLLVERAAPFVSEVNDGYPREFGWDAATDTMTFYPAPNDDFVVTARFVVEPSPLAADGDTTPIPVRFDQAVSFIAAARILEREADESNRSGAFTVRGLEFVDAMKRTLMTSARKTVTLGGRRTGRRSARRGAW